MCMLARSDRRVLRIARHRIDGHALYDIIMFFVNNAERIAKFVNTVIDSAADVLRGNIGGVVTKIEDVARSG